MRIYGLIVWMGMLAVGQAMAREQAQMLTTPSSIPNNAVGESIRRGQDYLSNTGKLLPQHVGNNLVCRSCHLGNKDSAIAGDVGTIAGAAPFVGVVARFPQYSARAGQVITLEQRINSCFERSMNGKPLDTDAQPMVDIVAYMTWLSSNVNAGQAVAGSGIKKLELARAPDRKRGAALYIERCAACHGADGAGSKDVSGTYLFPPLWGQGSFNIAAGMARQFTAAGYIKHNMPFGAGGTLSDDDAWDITGYVINQPRPDFAGKRGDWPKGDKPKDARY